MSRADRRTFCRTGLLAGAAVGASLLRASPSGAAVATVTKAGSDRRVAQLLAGLPTSDGAGVRLTRIIGQPALRNLDPFILLDRLHSDDPGAYIAGFPD